MEQTITNEPKYRLNIKQNAKKEMYFDITVKGESIEELTVEIENLKRLAMIQCGQIDATAQNEDTKNVSPLNSSKVIDEQPHETKNYAGVGIE